jgi:ATP-dependent exoDNAse (exonuclease V) beta subunit
MLKPFRRDLGDAKPTLVSQTSISVTALLEKHQFESDRGAPAPDKFIGQDNMKPLRMATSAARGTRLHRVFEMAKSASIDRQEKMASEIARWFRPDEQAAALAALQWVLAIKSPNLEAIIASGEVEWGFAYLAPQRQFIVEGQIDLWGRDTHGQLWIVDYKTGNTDYYEKAFEQLSYYSEALVAAGIAHLGEEVGLAAIFPYAQRIYEKSIIASFSNLPS